MAQQRNCYVLQVSDSASGDTTLVAAQAASSDGIPAMPIKVWQMDLVASGGANTLTFKSGSTATSVIGLTSNGAVTFQQTDQPWVEAKPGSALVLNLSAATAVVGTIYYTLG